MMSSAYQLSFAVRRRAPALVTRGRRGGMLVLLAFLLPIAVLIAAIAINLSYMELNRTELYIATDAATRAGGREFTLTGDAGAAKTKARALAATNLVAGSPLLLDDADFTFGQSVRTSLGGAYSFTPGGSRPNALELRGRRTTGSPSGPLPMLMPNVLGSSTFDATQIARSSQVEVDIAIVLDKSGSMAYAATEPAVYPPYPAAAPVGWTFGQAAPPNSRWRDAVAAVNVFLAELGTTASDERVSLCTYSTTAMIDTPLSNVFSDVQTAMDGYTNAFASGKTNIGGGIDMGRNSLASAAARPWATKVIVVLTDGINNAGGDPILAAQDAAGEKILIFTITFALEADQTLMHDIATLGLGKHYHASGGASLAAVFTDIARSLPILITR